MSASTIACERQKKNNYIELKNACWMQNVRKGMLVHVTFENTLLEQFKKFMQKVEKLTVAITKRGHRRITPQSVKIAEVDVQRNRNIEVVGRGLG